MGWWDNSFHWHPLDWLSLMAGWLKIPQLAKMGIVYVLHERGRRLCTTHGGNLDRRMPVKLLTTSNDIKPTDISFTSRSDVPNRTKAAGYSNSKLSYPYERIPNFFIIIPYFRPPRTLLFFPTMTLAASSWYIASRVSWQTPGLNMPDLCNQCTFRSKTQPSGKIK